MLPSLVGCRGRCAWQRAHPPGMSSALIHGHHQCHSGTRHRRLATARPPASPASGPSSGCRVIAVERAPRTAPIHLGCQGRGGWQCAHPHGMLNILFHGKPRGSSPTTTAFSLLVGRPHSAGHPPTAAPSHHAGVLLLCILTCKLTHLLPLSAAQHGPYGALRQGPPRPLPRKLTRTKEAPSLRPSPRQGTGSAQKSAKS